MVGVQKNLQPKHFYVHLIIYYNNSTIAHVHMSIVHISPAILRLFKRAYLKFDLKTLEVRKHLLLNLATQFTHPHALPLLVSTSTLLLAYL